MDLNHYILFWVCIAGLCLGSFYNVVILRSLSNESIVFPPSKCPKCNHKLFWWHNIPILSYIILKGKCYFCKEKISSQYPIIEFLTMLLFGITFYKFGLSIKTLFVLLWISCFIIMTATDLKEKVADSKLAIISAVGGLAYNTIAFGFNGFKEAILGLIIGALIIEIIARLGFIFVKSRAMGEADTYVAGALGAIFGMHNIVPVLLYGLIASMLIIVPIFLYNKYKQNDKQTCITAILFILSILVFETVAQNIFSLIFLFVTGCLLAYFVVKNINNEENRTYMPYIPALAAGALYFLFI